MESTMMSGLSGGWKVIVFVLTSREKKGRTSCRVREHFDLSAKYSRF